MLKFRPIGLASVFVLGLVLSASVAGANEMSVEDVRKRVAEIEKSIKTAQQKISVFSGNKLRNASLIEREQKRIVDLEEEKRGLQPMLQQGQRDDVQAARLKLRQDLERQIKPLVSELRVITSGKPTGALGSEEAVKLKKLQDAYLTLSMDMLLGQAVSSPRDAVMKELKASKDLLVKLRAGGTFKGIDAAVASKDKWDIRESKSLAEANYRIARLRYEAALMADLTLKGSNEFQNTAAYLEMAVARLVETDPSNVRPPSGRTKELHQWYLEMKREVDLEEFNRMAAHAPIFDDGKLVAGKTRQEIAYFSALTLADRVKSAAVTMPISSIFYPKDSRVDLAKRIRAKADDNPDHVIFGYLATGIEPSPRMYMLAVMRALRMEQEKVNTWLVNAYNQSWYNTGLGTLLRANGALGTGDASFEEVERRVKEYLSEVDAVHDVLERATKEDDPEKLSEDDRHLLEAFGYVVKKVDTSYEYAVPKEANVRGLTAGAQRGLKLPGAPLLDVITPKTVAITAVSTLVPGYAAGMAEAFALRAGAGMRTIWLAKMATEVGVGAALDATKQYAESGKVDAEAILIESILLGGIMEKANVLSSGVGDAFAKQLQKYQDTSVLRRLLSDKFVRDTAAEWVTESLGMASEVAITTLYEKVYKGKNVDAQSFFANVVNSAISRSVSSTGAYASDGKFLPQADFINRLPGFIKKRAQADPALAKEVYDLSREQIKMQDEAMQRYIEVVVEGSPTADALFKALLKGELSWMDLVIAYQRNTEAMTPLMQGVKELRDSFFEEIKHDAVWLARKELKNELGEKIDAIAEQHGNSEKGKLLLKQAMDEFFHDSRYMNEQIIAPGSKSPVSDIDRSMQHPRLRHLMEQMFEARARELSDGAYIPTSARAFDVNEYYNVMPFISDTNKMRPELDSVVAEAGFTHGDIMESFGYAAAMMHMNSIQQRNFRGHERRRLLNDLKKRKIEEGTPDYKSAVERFDKLFGRAQADLARGRLELRTKMEELGLDPKVPENEIRARSALYQERIEAYYGKLKKLDKLRKKRIGERPPGRTKKDRARIHKEMLAKEKADPELVKRRAEIEREMAYFLREGIETYSGSSTLDIVVVQMQIAKLKMGPALLDQNFTLAGSLSGLKKEHIDFMVRDQCLMMVEHVNGYFYGHELPYNSGKALAKYAQRALLAMKIKGDLNIKALVDASDMSDPALRLHRMCERLMEQKPNPTGFNDVLSSFTPEGNPDAGLVELINVIEKVVPGMEYQSDRDNFEHLPKLKTMSADANPFEVRRFFQYHRFIRLRENREVEEKVLKHGGAEVLEQYCKSRMTEVHTALQEIEERYARYMEMGSTYAPKDWPEVLRLERSIHGLKLVSRNVPGQPQPEWGKIVTGPMQKMERRLQELKQTRRTDLGPFSSPYYTRLWLQMNHLKLLITYYEEQLKKAAELKVKEAKLTALNLSGVWTFKNGDQKGRAKIEHNGRDIKIWLTSDILTAKAPHFIVEGTYRRGHILGYWTELHSPPLKFNARNLAPAKNWKNRGLFVGDVSIDRSFIKLTNASTELPRNDETGLRWAGMLLNPAGDDVSAPTNLEIFNVTQRSLPQKKPGEDSPSSPRRKMGSVYIKQYGPDGGHASTRFALYTPATYGTSKPDLVANGTTFSPKEVLPGTYELVVQLGSKLVRKNLSVRADEVTTYSLPALGQLKLKLIDHTGKEFYDPNFLLRVARNNKPIGWASDTPLKVGAATYQITIHRGGGPVGRGSSYTREVTVAEGQETLVTLRFGAFRFDLTDVDGKPSKGARVEIEYVSEDGSTGGTFSEMSSADIPLIPGKYRYKAWLQQGGSQSGEVQVLPAELEKQSSGLGMLSLLANGRPIRNSDKHSIMLTPLNPPGDFIVVHNLKRPQLFPGTYRAQLLDPEGKSSEKLEFTVESGKAANLDFKMK